MSNWKTVKLGDIAKIKGGKRLPKGSSLTSKKTTHPYIRITDLSNNSVMINDLQYVPDEVFPSIKRYIVNKGDVIVSIVGTIGLVSLITDELDHANLTENCVKLTNFPDSVYPQFIYYYLISRNGQYEIQKNEVGAVQKKLPLYGVSNIDVDLPDFKEQKHIAHILSTFDKKIELLQKQNKTLEAIAQTLYKRWFVDFEFPNADGEPYKSDGGKMVPSELGDIPEGWEVGKLKKMVKIFDSKRVPLSGQEREKRPGQYPYYGATKIMDYIDDYLFDGTFLLLAEDGSVITEEGLPVLQYVDGKFWVNNHTHVLQGNNEFSTEFLYLALRKRKISESITGAVQLKINQENLVRLEMIVAPQNTMEKFNKSIKPFFLKLQFNELQVKTLIPLRENLLKFLMSKDNQVKST